ncbi:MAG: ribbon-helix-helix domain-containing protein [Bifidobacteriaceae bacterium]|jgi:hypothetical protein|nr:ribbon-helix-helix domain-containing protein [Bifidobacteriaceae bacterium]
MTTYGRTAKGRPIDDAMIDRITAEAEAGFPAWKLKVGRPAIGAEQPSRSRTVRFPTGLDAAIEERARADHTTPSALIRRAVHEYLQRAA